MITLLATYAVTPLASSGDMDTLTFVSILGIIPLFTCFIRWVDSIVHDTKYPLNRIDILLWILACACPVTWAILLGAGLLYLAKSHDKPRS